MQVIQACRPEGVSLAMSDGDGSDPLMEGLRRGDPAAQAELVEAVHDELRRLARHYMAGQRPTHTLQCTALVNEAWIRLSRQNAWQDRTHFLRVASRAMRQILVDHKRRKQTDKRAAPGERVDLDALVVDLEERGDDLVLLDAALERLAAVDPELERLVELRFFAGSTLEEAALVLGISVRQAGRWWSTARAFLLREVRRG